MKRSVQVWAAVCLLAGASVATLVAARRAGAATTEKYLHIRVNDSESKETVNVNLPLSLAEKILPTINHGDLKDGRVSVGHAGMGMDNVDLRAILDALRNAPDNEFVTVKSESEDVRVAKSKGSLIIHVNQTPKPKAKTGKNADKDADSDNDKPEKVDITIPMSVVNALVPNDKKEIDVVGAIHALADAGESLLVTVHDSTNDVRIWVDADGSSK
jgi:hypothetical protein